MGRPDSPQVKTGLPPHAGQALPSARPVAPPGDTNSLTDDDGGASQSAGRHSIGIDAVTWV
jgi:hypothetical protein